MADFKTYHHIVQWLGKGKKKSEGRRKRSLMLRMVEDVVVVSHAKKRYGEPGYHLTDFAEIRSNNVFTFTIASVDMIPIAASISSVFAKVFGLAWHRVGRGRYNVFPWDEHKRNYWDMLRGPQSHEHFNGMAWDLNTNQCINPRPPILETVDKDQRKVWIAQLKKFRRMFHTKVKLGIVQQIIEEGHPTGKRAYDFDLSTEILEAIKAGDIHTDLLKRLVIYTQRKAYHRPIDSERVKRMVESIITGNSVQFRQEFGVLKK